LDAPRAAGADPDRLGFNQHVGRVGIGRNSK
jgi:hypothetical protein